MEYLLRYIVDFLPSKYNLHLVSKTWRNQLLQNDRELKEGIARKLNIPIDPSDDIHLVKELISRADNKLLQSYMSQVSIQPKLSSLKSFIGERLLQRDDKIDELIEILLEYTKDIEFRNILLALIIENPPLDIGYLLYKYFPRDVSYSQVPYIFSHVFHIDEEVIKHFKSINVRIGWYLYYINGEPFTDLFLKKRYDPWKVLLPLAISTSNTHLVESIRSKRSKEIAELETSRMKPIFRTRRQRPLW